MGKIIGLTYDLKTDWIRNNQDPTDINAEFDKPRTIEYVIAALEAGGHKAVRIGNVHKLLATIDDLSVDIVFNMCEGIAGRNRESQVPNLLELKGIPFIGADALTLGVTLDKVLAKNIFIAQGIPTAEFVEVALTDVDHIERIIASKGLSFPMIVKTRHEGSSKGISDDSVVRDYESLKRQVVIINTTYHQNALVEEFIRGTEFTIAVIGNDPPEAMPVVQTAMDGEKILGDRFYANRRLYDGSIKYICPADISRELTLELQDWAVKVYRAVECRDFGRVDFRVDESGRPYVLEINPLPSLEDEDVFHLFPKVMDSTFDKVFNKIIDCGLERYGQRV